MEASDGSLFDFVVPIPGFSQYWASYTGHIYSNKGGKDIEKKAYVEKCGYVTIGLTLDGETIQGRYRLHVIMALAWLDNPDNLPVVNHKDGNKQNNHINNLEYVSHRDNVIHAYANGLIKKNFKAVCQYDLKKKLIATYKSIKEASEKTNVDANGIGQACKKNQRTAGDFIWGYEGDKEISRNHGNAKYVLQYTKKGKFVAEHESVRVAAKAVNISIMSISNACLGKQKTAAKFVWKYKKVEKTAGELLKEEVKDWVQLKECPNYKISKDGRVYSSKFNIILKAAKNGSAETVGLMINGVCKNRMVHRLVALAYIPNPENFPVVNHIDGNQYNNDVKNLEFCTHSHNSQHAYDTGLTSWNSPVIQMDVTGNEIQKFSSIKEASEYVGVSVGPAVQGRNKTAGGFKWKYA